MNLATLRRLVLVGNVVALGVAAWSTHGVLWSVEPLRSSDWAAIFPAKPANSAEVTAATKDPLDAYRTDIGWAQGEKPKPPEPVPENTGPPPPPPLAQRYSLRTVWEGATLFDSFAQLGRNAQPNDMALSVRVGTAIEGDPDWVLDNVSLRADGRVTATFRNTKGGERVTLEGSGMAPGEDAEFKLPKGAGGGRDLAAAKGADAPAARPVIRLVSSDDVRGERVYDIPEEDGDWIGVNLDDEVRKISAQPATGPDGKAAGVVLKAVPASSRLSEMGFQNEDRVISVNEVPVTSLDNAIQVGKSQYEGGTTVFKIKAERRGKILTYTYRAKPKKQ